MEILNIGKYEFIKFKEGNANFIFTTAKGNFNLDKAKQEGLNNLDILKDIFQLDKLGYLHQIHSDKVYVFDGEVKQGDGLITKERNVGIGAFNADCVPVLFYDKSKKVIAAVHSGWRSTYAHISEKAVYKMIDEFGTNPKDLVVYIGPHNRQCCYEIGEEVAEKFINDNLYENLEIVKDGKLNLEMCIEVQLQAAGVDKKNINTLGICTYCNKDFELYSFRRQKEEFGEMLGFIYLD